MSSQHLTQLYKELLQGTKYSHTYYSIYSHVKKSPWSYDVEDPVDILKNRNHHFIFIFGRWPKT